jgi:NAD(P)-dependent dehydrogenase (short-subunit alcohol dehydrogenase family)
MTNGSANSVCAVVGVGPGNGEAFARRFSADGYRVALMARRTELSAKLAAELPNARAYACDVADAASVADAFSRIRGELGEVDVLVFNAGSGVWGSIEDVKPEDFERAWRVNALGLFLTARQVIPAMRRKGKGAIVVGGAASPARRPSPRPRWRNRGWPSRWRGIFGRLGSTSRSSWSTASSAAR